MSKVVGYQPKRTDSAIDNWVQITWDIVVNKKKNVTLMDVKKHNRLLYKEVSKAQKQEEAV